LDITPHCVLGGLWRRQLTHWRLASERGEKKLGRRRIKAKTKKEREFSGPKGVMFRKARGKENKNLNQREAARNTLKGQGTDIKA